MKTSLLASALLAAVLPAAALAGPKEDVAAAAKKLTEAENYSWTTTTEMGGGNGGGGGGGGGRNFRPGPVEGKTLKSGITFTTMKFGDNTSETFAKDGKFVTKRDGAWKTPQELAAERSADGGGNGGGRGRGGFGGGAFRNLKSPAEQAAETASKIEKFEEKDGAIIGTLSPEAVKGLLTFGGGGRRGGAGGDGGNRPEPKDTSGTVTYWLKDGAIAKVQTHVKGTVSANGEDREIDRKTTTEFSAVGSTKLEVPEEVTKKLAEAKAPE